VEIGDRRSKIKVEEEELLKKMVAQTNDIYLREIQELMQQKMGLEISLSSLSRNLNRLNLGRKKADALRSGLPTMEAHQAKRM
jgi:transposase